MSRNQLKQEMTTIKFRLPVALKEKIKCKAQKSNMTVSEYLRIKSCDIKITEKQFDDLNKIISYEIKKIGNNINQIAHQYNTYDIDEPSTELNIMLKQLNEKLDLIEEKLEDIKYGDY
ncbi:mobilisation protein (MobC) [Eubacterium uniforme]|uniref:Mobilisation protein (MobC) n=1 Tax=Eubacterium uniforme TaxID=39495 RepID=A0A1T4W6X0_9FIRM|nr:plasmid mobilization relaxosome protein MobC [Eubacterium uniforme]SKA73074.1 mobilisation protein (MobC) [Eubacterium uniforme]